MKIAGIVLTLIGSFVLLIGVVVCIVTLRSDYATKACRDAERDAPAIRSARQTCRGLDNDCYRRSVADLTTQEECDSRRAYMNNQLIIGVVPTVVGGLLAFVGLVLMIFGSIRAKRKRSALRPDQLAI